MKTIVSEKLLERKLREGVKKAGGLALKWTSPGFRNVPDRIVLTFPAKVRFVEVKTTGKKPSAGQLIVITMLRKLGFEVWVIDTNELLTEFLKSL